ncbi:MULTISPECIES: FAD-dependent oxidoreductase [unclassified Mesorhizobium]|uniref:FAD-dependent oxidoreductase n=1 Tax=unclassified Mesorhizobium TaxID=325217 RepID=UPI000F7500F1|nr:MULTISPECIES: FAD-dependent oxidoreductase [unclassified Mesorhizobium]TGT56789.1 FAD-dependent oxidoreductase [Mesorhizobium sp. M00.F.Ca.ET.170.01.1.1]AZO08556.1 FAD-dependent oxidoreductase [Mesorhizobium sp. M3A.F.Ca.ET.080.04.2.1]RWB71674.1 MAG: FAD-dependent oxidoreductase [Mesorhizobium sp.]RWE23118.1 MAG: FAD-dependent oxidoreductase [Mesorhizobium sp.]RWF24451.1 MAG: FAD-dependent oxidoreductase [Mesorhizobium sp.]
MNASDEQTRSLWMDVAVLPDAPRLDRNLTCDTAIIGAGIAGLSTAHELAVAGRKVVVIDRGRIAGGMTARTTAHLTPICDDGIDALIDLRGEAIAKLFQQSQQAAVDRVEALVGELGIDCDFRRLDGFLFPAKGMESKEARDRIEEQYEAARKAGAPVEPCQGIPLKGFETAPALRYPGQATFHPLKYLKRLAAAILDKGGLIFADTAVTGVEEHAGRVHLTSETGHVVEAASAVAATNAPTLNRFALHSKMAPYRTYAMAFGLPRDALPDALYWDLADPYHYVRLNPGPGSTDYLIVGGADHKSGEADDGHARFEAIEAWIRTLVPDLGKEVHRWSGQVLDTIDYCGFIGRNPGSENIYVATGDSGQGITHGVLAGMLLKDLIVGGANRWEEVYDPSRKTPTSIINFLTENATALKNFAEYLKPGEIDSAEELRPGQGGTLREGLHKLAVCRDLNGELHVNAAACTHLGCHLHWNSTEQCWDCPCHGSQFAPDGSVLNGPAVSPLKKATLSDKAHAA